MYIYGVLEFGARRESFVWMPPGVEEAVPSGMSLEILLAEIGNGLRNTATPFSIRPRAFDLPLDEALALITLEDDGFPEAAAWWLVREAAVANAVAAIHDES